MLIIDFSGTLYASVLRQVYLNSDQDFDENLARHSIIHSLRKYKKKFHQYGNPIIVFDGKNYWRRDLFPYYKSQRRKDKEEGKIKGNWTKIFDFFNKIQEEIKLNFPWVTIQISKAEADDIIAHLVQKSEEPVMIVSRDHDLIQLQRNDKIQQYNPVDDRYETTENVGKFLFEHICRGDKGDGIPSIVNPDNSLALGVRQKPLRQKSMDEWWQTKKVPSELLNRFTMNRKLIDLNLIPIGIRESIDQSLTQRINKNASIDSIIKYFRENDLNELIKLIGDFI